MKALNFSFRETVQDAAGYNLTNSLWNDDIQTVLKATSSCLQSAKHTLHHHSASAKHIK